MSLDPRSDRIVLHYTGDESGQPYISGVPARDLTENDVARLLFVEHGDELHGAAQSAAVGKLYDRLTAGPYRRTEPSKPAAKPARKAPAPAPEPESTNPPAPPASEPEV